jgi:tetratricopeptide (TPR) repeat protein
MPTIGWTKNSRVGRGLILILLGLLAAAAYANSLQNDFVGDDSLLILKNRAITRLESLPALLTSDYWTNFRGPYESAPAKSSGLYRPLVSLSYALNHALGGMNPWGYHLLNVGLHALVTWLVFLVASRLGIACEPALVAAAIFAVHPLHTEAVAQVVGRAELLMSLGVLAAVWFGLGGRRRLALLAFTGALFSKEQAMILPVLLFAHDLAMARPAAREGRWMGSGTWLKSAVSNYWPYLAVLGGYLAIRTKVLGGFPLPPLSAVENPLAFLDWGPRLLTALKVAGWYLRLFIWPGDLLADYSGNTIPVAHSVFEPAVLWGLGAWAILLGLAARSFVRGESRSWFAIALTVLGYLPISNLVVPIGTIMAERLFYLPSAGLCLLAGLAYERLTSKVSAFSPQPSAFSLPPSSLILPPSAALVTRHLSQLLVILICLALTARTVARNKDWKDDETLFRQAVAMAPENAKAHVFLSGALRKKGRFAEALDAYDTAARLNPAYLRDDPHFLWHRGILLVKLGRAAEGIEAMEQAATLDPNWGRIRLDLGLAYATAGNYERAEAVLRQAVSITPGSPHVHNGLSLILNERGRFAEALAAADAALERDPAHLWARYNRAMALEGLGRLQDAAVAYGQVLALTPALDDRRAYEEAQGRLKHLRSLPRRNRSGLCPPGFVGC